MLDERFLELQTFGTDKEPAQPPTAGCASGSFLFGAELAA